MSSPGGDEVARVSVRVVPDVSHFREDLRRELASLKDEDLKIPVKLDLDKADLERQLQELDLQSIEIPVTFKVEDARDDIARATKGAKVDPINIPVDLDEARLQAEMAKVKAQLDELDNRKVTPHVELLQASFRAQLAELNAELDKLRAAKAEIPVKADTDAAKAAVFDLKAALSALQKNPTQIKFDLQEAELLRGIARVEGELAKLDGEAVTPEVGLKIAKALAELEAFQAELNRLDGKRIEAVANLDVDTLRADAQIQAFLLRMRARRKIKLNVDVDESNFSQLERTLTGVARNIGAVLGDVFSGIGGVLNNVFSNIGPITQGLIGAGAAALQFAGMLALAGTAAIALAAAGAAITAAYGTAATAVAALPAALGLIAAPAAAVMLGLDGIKKAAQAIKPQFDVLKASVSDVFQKGLTPIFQNLATIFPKITDSIKNVASALVGTAFTIQQLITSSQGVAQINTIFNNAAQAIRNMQPGIKDLISGFLILSTQSGVFDALTAAVNTFGTAFKNNVVATIRDGSLTAAFAGLRDALSLLAQGFADLVKNGIELFAAAAPGLNAFLASIIGFFNRFDWKALGASVSGVFQGLADTIRNIPQGTIDSIQQSFQRLSQVFQDKAFQDGLQQLIALIPGAIDWLGRLAEGFARTALALRGSYEVIVGAVKSIALALQALTNDPSLLFSDKFKAELDAANQQVTDGLAKIQESYAKFDPQLPPSTIPAQIDGQMSTVVATAEQKMAALKVALQRGMSEAQTVLVGGWKGTGTATVSAANTALAPVAAVGSVQGKGFFEAWDAEMDRTEKGTDKHLKVIPGSVSSELGKVPPAAAAALAPLPPEVAAALGQVPPAAEGALAPLQQLQALEAMKTSFGVAFLGLVGTTKLGMESISATVAAGVPGIVAAFNFQNVGTQLGLAFQGLVGTATLGMASLAATVTSGMPAIQAAFNFQNVGTTVGQAFLGMVGSFTLGMASLAATVTAGMPAIQAAFNFQNVGLQVGLAFQGLVGTVTLGMQSFAASVTAGMVLVQQAFATGFSTALTGAITTGFAGLKVATDAGMLSIIDAIRLGGTLMQATLHVAIGLMATDVTTQFVLVQSATVDGMQSIVDTISGSMPAVNSAFDMTALSATVGIAFQGLVGTFTLGMASIAVAVTSGMAQASASMSAGMSGMAAAAAAGMSGVTSAIMAGMAIAIAAVDSAGRLIGASAQASMAGFGNSIRAGMAAATAAVAAGTAQMIAQFTQLAQQIVTTATQSMAAFGNAVRSGMAQAQAAVASGVSAMLGVLRAGAGQFSAVGVQMMNGLRAGILSQAGSIAAAAAAVVSGAIAAARAAAAVHSPSRAFMDIGSFMGEGLAIGLEDSAPRVAAAADKLASAAVDTADKITAAFSGDSLGADLSAKVEHSFSDAVSTTSTKDVVGQLRALNGNVDQSSYLSAIIALLQAIAAQGQGGNAAMGAQTSRRYAELGAF